MKKNAKEKETVKEKSFDFKKYNFTYDKIPKDVNRKRLDIEDGNYLNSFNSFRFDY